MRNSYFSQIYTAQCGLLNVTQHTINSLFNTHVVGKSVLQYGAESLDSPKLPKFPKKQILNKQPQVNERGLLLLVSKPQSPSTKNNKTNNKNATQPDQKC